MADLMYSRSQDKYYRQNDLGEYIEVPKYQAEKGAVESAMIATGETLGGVWDWLAPESMQIGVNDPTNKQAMQGLRELNPVATTVGDVLPSLATAPVTFGGGLIGNLAGQAALGAGTEYLLSGGDGKAAAMGAVGGIGGEIAGRIIGRATNAAKGFFQGTDDISAQAARYMETGGEVLPSQRYETKGLDIIEKQLESGTYSGELFSDVAKRNQENLNELAVNALGIKGVTDLTQTGLELADETLGQMFSDVASDIGTISVSREAIKDFADLAPGMKYIKSPELKQFMAQMGEEGAPDVIDLPANKLMQIRTELTSQIAHSKSASKTQALGDALDQLDDLIAGQAGKEAGDAYQALRKKYELLQVLKSGNVVREGDVSQNLLRNKLKTHYGSSFENKMGRIDPNMGMLAQNVAAGTSKDFTVPFGRSGTAERSGGLNPMGIAQRMVAEQYLKNPAGAAGFFGGLLTPGSEMSPMATRFASGLMAGSFRGLGRDNTED
jgi:hypothetical protein